MALEDMTETGGLRTRSGGSTRLTNRRPSMRKLMLDLMNWSPRPTRGGDRLRTPPSKAVGSTRLMASAAIGRERHITRYGCAADGTTGEPPYSSVRSGRSASSSTKRIGSDIAATASRVRLFRTRASVSMANRTSFDEIGGSRWKSERRSSSCLSSRLGRCLASASQMWPSM